MKLFVSAVTASVVLLAACSNPQKASDSNFKTALQAHFDKPENAICIKTPLPTYMRSAFSDASFNPDTVDSVELKENDSKFEQAVTLTKAGFFTASYKEGPDPFAPARSERLIKFGTFKLTEKGNKEIKRVSEPIRGKYSKFCSGKWEVTDIENFTEPYEMGGLKISRVSFKTRPVQTEAWVHDTDILAAYPG